MLMNLYHPLDENHAHLPGQLCLLGHVLGIGHGLFLSESKVNVDFLCVGSHHHITALVLLF